ncbi:MAG: DUF2177 family protein [Candidatus Eremiobacteraeota bacterium]|nr:DUF2177 family protein [Candidatus Eremiobacteraeota bacterium]
MIKTYLLTLVFLLVLDYVWLGLIMNRFYARQLGGLGRTEGGNFKPVIWAACMVYLLIPLGIVVFVLPGVDRGSLVLSSAGRGALFGLVLYGVYDFTNYSLLKDYPKTMTFADILWGTFLCSVTSVFSAYAGFTLFS